jgi:3-hydroxyisobutyrate dehydrogenase-like beta-hydroxyacid dehydrogenase
VADHDLPNLLAGNDDPTFTLALCRKDLRLIAALADEAGYPAEAARLALERFEAAYDRFGPEAGELTVARLAEEAAGASIRG